MTFPQTTRRGLADGLDDLDVEQPAQKGKLTEVREEFDRMNKRNPEQSLGV
jgi:hypothetical protein